MWLKLSKHFQVWWKVDGVLDDVQTVTDSAKESILEIAWRIRYYRRCETTVGSIGDAASGIADRISRRKAQEKRMKSVLWPCTSGTYRRPGSRFNRSSSRLEARARSKRSRARRKHVHENAGRKRKRRARKHKWDGNFSYLRRYSALWSIVFEAEVYLRKFRYAYFCILQLSWILSRFRTFLKSYNALDVNSRIEWRKV